MTSSYDAALQDAAAQGVNLTAKDYEKMTELQVAEQQRLTKLHQQAQGKIGHWLDVIERHHPAFIASLIRLGDMLMTTTQTVVTSIGVPLVLVLLLIVEQTRVQHGIALFETDDHLTVLGAWALVLLNLTLEFIIHFIENQADYHTPEPVRWSIRHWQVEFDYWSGQGRRWKPQLASPAQRFRHLLHLVTFSILVLALAGSMQSVMADLKGSWITALISIIFQSSLNEMATWVSGLLFAAAAVFSAQALSRYVAVRCLSIRLQSPEAESSPFQDELELVAINYIQAKIAAKHERKARAGELSGLKHDVPHWKDTDWQPTPESYPCECGCGEDVTWQGIGRKPRFVDDAHRKRFERRK